MDPTHSGHVPDRMPIVFRIKGGVILKIWPAVLVATLFSAAIVSVHSYVPGMTMDFPIYLVAILGLVIGLLLVFRTNTAYDRYWEGRKIWANMTNHIRILTRCCWLGVKESATDPSKDLIEKISAINVLVAFAYATKNYLREEYSYENDEDIRELINHLPRLSNPDSVTPFKQPHQGLDNPMKISDQVENEKSVHVNLPDEVKNGKSVHVNLHDEVRNGKSVHVNFPDEVKNGKSVHVNFADPVEGIRRVRNSKLKRKTMSVRRRVAEEKNPLKVREGLFVAHDYVVPTKIPLELTYFFQTYIYWIMGREMVDGTTTFVLMGSLNHLMDSLTQFERILRTPIPLAYSIHLQQAVWLYLLALPFQLVGRLGWFTVPAILLASFALLGILAIGWEIENPFGYDDNDLPLDDFCEVIRKECSSIVGTKLPDPDSWIFSPKNHPFIPASYETASELNKRPIQELRDILANGTDIPSCASDE